MALGDTFSFNPSFSFTETEVHRTLISIGENGREQRRSKFQDSLRRFKLNHNAIQRDTGANLGDANEGDDVDLLFQFFNNRRGRFDIFTFTNPIDGSNYTVRFADDEISRENFIAKIHSIGLELVEVRQ